ncbi:Leucine rich repeat [Novymonas esmeraldas]|uniref:Leucine rich repeat n=1 Tax=Novymonas esmeraldas TaxID=1808958 RepID=A0AAW0EX69_9TRYP
MLSNSAVTSFAGEVPDRDTLHDVMRYIPYNRRTLTAMRCVSKPFRSAVQSPQSPWAPRKEIMVSRYGQCILFNAQEDEQGRSNFALCSISAIGRKFRTHSAKLLSRYHVLVANGLSRLVLHHAPVDNAFFEPLGVLVNLRELELVSCRGITSITEASCIKNLTSLTVVFCPVEPDGAAGLLLPQLQKLTLRCCSKLSNLGAIAAETCAALVDVHVESCDVHDDNTSFFEHLGPNVRSLNLTAALVDMAIAHTPNAALESLTSLVACETILRSWTLDLLSPFLAKSLEYLSLENCESVDRLSALGSLVNLRFLDVSRLRVLQEIDCVAQCTKLEMFRCSDTELGGITFLKDLRHLRVLDVSNTSLTDYSLIHLEESPELDTVVLTGCLCISSINAFHRCPKIRRILCGRTAVTNEGVDMLPECPMLEEIDLKMTNVTDVNRLADCPSLKTINVCGSIMMQDAVQRLLDKPSVEVICDSFDDADYMGC